MTRRILITFTILIGLLAACTPSTPEMEPVIMPDNIHIQSLDFEKSFFEPAEKARWTLTIFAENPARIVLVTTITSLDRQLAQTRQELDLPAGEFEIQLAWQPPETSPQGYGLDIRLETPGGQTIDALSSAFDVLDTWTQNPRYGFMTDFSPNRTDGAQAVEILKRYHINGLQFYDWMYRHDTYLPPQDVFTGPLGRQLSFSTTKNLISLAHQNGMAAMPYTAVYAASIPFYQTHKDWALLESSGEPSFFGDNFLVIMDPRPESPWTLHLLDQFAQILAQTGFDGIHLDQYGAPKKGYDAQGMSYDLDEPLADLIDSTAAVVDKARGKDGAVIFNAVTNWPIETVAPSNEDVVYIEVWPPYTGFNDLSALIRQAQRLGGNKPVVIAAYIDPAYEINARLNDAIIFASGAGHIELGELGGYLADPYFPKYEMPSADLSAVLQRYYEFAIRYQNAIGPGALSGEKSAGARIKIEGVKTTPALPTDKVMVIDRSTGTHTALSLVNFVGLEHGNWADGLTNPPTPLLDAKMTIKDANRQAARIWFATPDREDLSLQPVEFQQDGAVITLTVPSLDYWSLILIEWSSQS